MEKTEKYKKAEKELEELAPSFTLALMIYCVGGMYMQILRFDNIAGTGFIFLLCVILYIIFCFLYVRKHKAHNQVANSNAT